MDVTKQNFNEVLPTVLEKLQTCKFVSLDLEMSGIYSTDRSKRIRKDDTPAQRYSKMIGPATTYSIIQFGLSIFHESEDGTLTASPYNFYLFPEFGADIAMSVSSIDFLRKNELNFGDWINYGVNFTDGQGEAWARKHCNLEEEKEEKTPRRYVSLSKQSDIDSMEAVFENLATFLDSPTEMIYEFESCNSFLRRYIYEQVELRYADSLVLKKNENGVLCAFKIDKESKNEFEKKRKEENLVKFKNMIGFRQVFNALVALKKPIVGHNLLYDLMFIHRWLDSALPEDFTEFKKSLNAMFPNIFDTKYVDSSGALGVKYNETTLAQCYARYKTVLDVVFTNDVEMGDEVEVDAITTAITATSSSTATSSYSIASSTDIVISSDCTFDPNVAAFHNAGYDAYCTGYVFAKQLQHYTAIFAAEHKKSFIGQEQEGHDSANCNRLAIQNLAFASFHQACVNKTFMMQSLFHMSLDGASVIDTPKYEGAIFRVTNFPYRVQTQDVLQACTRAVESKLERNDFGSVDTTVVWVDDKSFFVIVNEPRLSMTVLMEAVITSIQKEEWDVQTYEDYQLSLAAVDEDTSTPGGLPLDEAKDSIFPGLHKRLSSWMTGIFSSCSTNEDDGSRGSVERLAKKRARVE